MSHQVKQRNPIIGNCVRIERLESRTLLSVDLSTSVSLVSPTSHQVKPGQPATFAIIVTNEGTSTASGPLTIDVELSKFLDGASPESVTTVQRNVKLAAGHQLTVRETIKPSTAFALGTYFGVVNIDPSNTFGETNLANNTAVTTSSLVVNGLFPDLSGVWSGPVIVKKGVGKGSSGTQTDEFTSMSQVTGQFTFTGSNFIDGVTFNLAGSGTVTKTGAFQDSGTDVPLDSIGEFKGKGKVNGETIVIQFKNAINSGTITLSRS